MKFLLAALLIAFSFPMARADPLVVRVTTPPPPQSSGSKLGELRQHDGTRLTLDSNSLRLNGKPWMPASRCLRTLISTAIRFCDCTTSAMLRE